MATNKPEIIGYVPTKDGNPRCGEDGLSLDDYTDLLRDNPADLKLEPIILLRDYESLQAECETLRKASSELANWCYYEVGADIELTPGLKQVMGITGVVYDKE